MFKYAKPIWIEKKADGTFVAHERTADEMLALELNFRRLRLQKLTDEMLAKISKKKRKEDTQKEACKWMWFEELSAFDGTENKRQGESEYKHEYLGEVIV